MAGAVGFAVALGALAAAGVRLPRAGAAGFALLLALPPPGEELNRPRLSLVYVRPARPFAMVCYLMLPVFRPTLRNLNKPHKLLPTA